MRYASLGSGSKGNATLVESNDCCLMIDCGFSLKETRRRLARLDKQLSDISAVLLTHEHGDHIRGVRTMLNKWQIPVYMTQGTMRHSSLQELETVELIEGSRSFQLSDFEILPVTVPHDAREPCQFVFSATGVQLGMLTDLGCVSAHVVGEYAGCDALMLESNYDPAMLANGPYPASVKRRVAGNWGHLSNEQAANLLESAKLPDLRQLIVAHISETNNSIEHVKSLFGQWDGMLELLLYAKQSSGFDWIDLK